METLINILHQYPAIAIFLTVGLGFYIGKIKFKSFTLGSVTAVLLTGLVVGQLDIPVSGQIKSVFFMMFLFSIGYSVGPRFFSSLRGSGLKQAAFALCISVLCFITTMIAAKLMSYNVGESMGLYSGAQTSSSLLGVSGDAISSLNMPEEQKVDNLDLLTVCYAVTYIIGTLGAVIILGNFGPKLLGGLDKVKAQTSALETEMDRRAWESDPANTDAMRAVAFRAYIVENEFFSFPKTVQQTERYLRDNGLYVFVDRVERQNKILR
ncbi:MAG: aspartate-alanine antiporter, partial [Muribaculaceae bacterium]|nr:aspartate-alanine antiporter [Muribaculaceae bacterium]